MDIQKVSKHTLIHVQLIVIMLNIMNIHLLKNLNSQNLQKYSI